MCSNAATITILAKHSGNPQLRRLDGWYDHVSGPIINHSTNNGMTDPSIPGIGGDNNDTNANDSSIPNLPLSTSTVSGQRR